MLKTCEFCNVEFNARRSIIRFCGQSCSSKWRVKNHPLPASCFKKGVSVWNKGIKMSGMSGKRHSQETKEKMRLSSSGPLSSNWKGGITEENYRIRRSKKYADWRTSVFIRDGYSCQSCGAKSSAGNRVRLEADHIKPFATFPELRFDLDNGRTLCASCHRKTPTWGVTRKEAVNEATGSKFND